MLENRAHEAAVDEVRTLVAADGAELDPLVKSQRSRHVGLIFQFFNLMPVLSARDNYLLHGYDPVFLPDEDGLENPGNAARTAVISWSSAG